MSVAHADPRSPLCVPCSKREYEVSGVLALYPRRRPSWYRRLWLFLYVSLRRRVLDWRAGLRYGYPVCCVLRFALSHGEQARRRGVCVRGAHAAVWVPCRIFHRPDHSWTDWSRVDTEGYPPYYDPSDAEYL